MDYRKWTHFLVNQEGEVVYIHRLIAPGLSLESVLGQILWEIGDPEYCELKERMFRRALSGEPVLFEAEAFGEFWRITYRVIADRSTPELAAVAVMAVQAITLDPLYQTLSVDQHVALKALAFAKSPAETAADVGCSESAIRSRLAYSRTVLGLPPCELRRWAVWHYSSSLLEQDHD